MLDYRLKLANERTFLAWMRTCLALMAAAVAVTATTTKPVSSPANTPTFTFDPPGHHEVPPDHGQRVLKFPL
ncbi:MAG TPA: hypothetical protein DEQ61_23020 [Streptomyces sp.]|nr:hypothetical protein [Streptomyces sp.]